MKNKNWNICTFTFTILRIGLVIGLMIWLAIIISQRNTGQETLSSGEKSLIIFSFIFLIITYILISTYTVMSFYYEDYDGYLKLIVLSIISLNIEIVIFGIIKSIKEKKQIFKFKKPQKWNVFDLSILGLLLGVYLLIEFVSSFVPPLPFWITPSFKYVILLFAAYILPFLTNLFLCITISALTLVMPGTAIMSPVQYLFDYVFVIWAFSLAVFFRPMENIKNKAVKILQWNIYVFVPMILVYWSRVISGVAFWLNPAAYDGVTYSFNWDGAFTYSMIYNSFNTIVDYVVLVILVPIVCIPLKFLKVRSDIWRHRNEV